MGVGHEALELRVGGAFEFVEVLAVELVLAVGHTGNRVRVQPGNGVAEDVRYVHIGAPVERCHFAGVDVQRPQAALVVAVIGDDVELISIVDIETCHDEGAEVVLVLAMDLLPPGRAELAVVPHEFLGGDVETAPQPRVAVTVERHLSQRQLAADNQLPRASPEVELVIGARSERGADSGCGSILTTLLQPPG